jgi:probable HAF family extracellular repeat protein
VAIDLGTLGGTTSQANGINNYGQIVGYAYTTGGVQHAAIWTNSNTAAIDLNGLIPTNSGWVLEAATAVNDSGEIVGYGINSQNPSNHYQDAFALLPPAPSILSITLSGNNVTVVWNGTAGSNVVQVSTGTSTGGYSNNFVNVATTILPIFGVASYTDYGGATNGPSRFYRIQATGQ